MLIENPAQVYLDDLIQIATDVFVTMIALPVEPVDLPPVEPPELTAAIHFTGQWNGALMIHCTRPQAAVFAERLLGIAVAQPDDVTDALAELANMVGGNMKSIMPRGVQLTMPLVVTGEDYTVRLHGEALTTKTVLASEVGLFSITLVEIIGPEI